MEVLASYRRLSSQANNGSLLVVSGLIACIDIMQQTTNIFPLDFRLLEYWRSFQDLQTTPPKRDPALPFYVSLLWPFAPKNRRTPHVQSPSPSPKNKLVKYRNILAAKFSRIRTLSVLPQSVLVQDALYDKAESPWNLVWIRNESLPQQYLVNGRSTFLIPMSCLTTLSLLHDPREIFSKRNARILYPKHGNLTYTGRCVYISVYLHRIRA